MATLVLVNEFDEAIAAGHQRKADMDREEARRAGIRAQREREDAELVAATEDRLTRLIRQAIEALFSRNVPGVPLLYIDRPGRSGWFERAAELVVVGRLWEGQVLLDSRGAIWPEEHWRVATPVNVTGGRYVRRASENPVDLSRPYYGQLRGDLGAAVKSRLACDAYLVKEVAVTSLRLAGVVDREAFLGESIYRSNSDSLPYGYFVDRRDGAPLTSSTSALMTPPPSSPTRILRMRCGTRW